MGDFIGSFPDQDQKQEQSVQEVAADLEDDILRSSQRSRKSTISKPKNQNQFEMINEVDNP